MTTGNHEEPADVLERYLPAQPKLQKSLDKTKLERRLPVALCLRDPDHVFTVKPGFRPPRKQIGEDGNVAIVEYGRMAVGQEVAETGIEEWGI